MIISCEKCYKKFEIDSKLIPTEGRLLKCGSCNNEWFFKKESDDELFDKNKVDFTSKTKIKKNNDKLVNKTSKQKSKNLDITIKEEYKPTTNKLNKKSSIQTKNISSLNFILVFLISIISFILIIDTFKKPISLYIPNIEYLLENLYETLLDLKLFIKDLLY